MRTLFAETLPGGWRIGRLGHVADAWPSNVDKHTLSGQKPVRLCNYTDVYKNPSIHDGMNFMRATAAPEQIERFRLARGDTVITKDSETADDIGIPAFVEFAADDFVCGYHLAIVRPSNAVHPKYLYWVLASRPTLAQWAVLAAGVTRVGIRSTDLTKVSIPLPPIEVQRAIADYLDRETARIDTLIAEQQRLIALLRERRVAIVRHSLVPTGNWGRSRIKNLARTDLGKMLDAGRTVREFDESCPYVRAADVLANGAVNLTDLNQMPFSVDELMHFDLRRGDVLLIEGGATVGRPGFMTQDAPGIAFQKTVNRLRCGPELDPRFAYWSMLALYEADYYSRYFGSVSFVHLTGEKLREIPLAHPVRSEQRRIAAYLDEQTAKIDTLIGEAERFIELSRERRTALITAAVTGQLDVRDVA